MEPTAAALQRSAAALQRVQPPPRAARKSEWLRSALAHHHCPDPGVENEVVVLATGMDQYLQEVFHHLALPNREDTVSAEDFAALCAALGLTGAERGQRTVTGRKGDGQKDDEEEEFRDVCSELPGQLSFKDFHSRLCGYFRVRGARRGAGDRAWRQPGTDDTELVERQIRVRWPGVRRRKCVSFDLSREQPGAGNTGVKGRAAEERDTDEVVALRELVEDLRSALQGSDARCLALEVALRRERSRSLTSPSSFTSTASSPTSSITLKQGKLVPTSRIKGAGGDMRRVAAAARRRDIRDPLVRELKLIRSSRDGQLDEAMKFNQRLEEELRWAYQEVRKVHGVEAALRKENAQIRRKAEEAREALSLGLQRVRLIQEQAQCVPLLQSTISRLESELQQYRSCCTCIPDPAHPQSDPIREEDACNKTEAECLQRAVEGRAASDEEEEDRGQCCLLDVKKQRLHSCGKGCQQSQLHENNLRKDSRRRCSWKGPNQEQPEGNRGSEQEQRPEEEEDRTRPEEEEDRTRPKEKEKTRLSLLEDKLTDALTLLLQLRNKNLSRRTLEKIVMETLDVCSRSGDGPAQVLQVADALCLRLSSRDLLGTGEEDEGEKGHVLSAGCQSSSINPLLISC